jgi:hypothetical protein
MIASDAVRSTKPAALFASGAPAAHRLCPQMIASDAVRSTKPAALFA